MTPRVRFVTVTASSCLTVSPSALLATATALLRSSGHSETAQLKHLEIASTISGESFVSGPRLLSSSNPLFPSNPIVASPSTLLPSSHFVIYAPPIPFMSPHLRHSLPRLYRFAKFVRFYATTASPSHYAISNIDGSSKSRPHDPPIPFLVASSSISAHYYVTAESPLHYTVSSINDYLHSRHCEPLTRAVILYGVSQTSYSLNLLVGFFNVDLDFFAFLRTWVLGLQVKLLYGSLLSIATSIFRHILVIFIYQFAVDDLSSCN
ncbi:hypothetical protein IGI04_015675 [Brassica rapa subsp. trilocularis]|uniref:Uncharacterized protein n=1 Tax=Brassica rapa subsp. trilocularis TaxID=1813537 RepID=A0ABQ7MS87_BRACM|nr:hypothetical protein IGI04_015675 [Brassica rapa subsp. trilocularis]